MTRPAPLEPAHSSGARLGFAAAYVAALAYIAATLADLPERVASSFGFGGGASGFMSRGGYAALFLSLAAGIPLAISLAFSWLPRRVPHLTNVPQRELWLAPERRGTLLARLDAAGGFLASACALFFAAMHALILAANAQEPPRLANGPFLVLLGAFLAAVFGTIAWLQLVLRKPPP